MSVPVLRTMPQALGADRAPVGRTGGRGVFPADRQAMATCLRALGVMAEDDDVVALDERPSVRNACLVLLGSGRSLFVKQTEWSWAEASWTLADAGGTRTDPVADLMPRRLAGDPGIGLVVSEGVADHAVWMDLLEGDEGYDPDIATCVGRALAAIHRLEPARLSASGAGAPSPALDYDAISVREYAAAAGLHFRRFVQAAQGVSGPLTELRSSWREAAVVHADFKADNVLVRRQPGDPSVRVVDWELCRMGDPAYDVGTAIGSVVFAWFGLLPPRGGQDLTSWFGSAAVGSGRLAGAIDAFARGYRRDAPSLDTGFWDRAWSYAGLFLLERGYVATCTVGRLRVLDALAMDLGVRALADPAGTRAAFRCSAAATS